MPEQFIPELHPPTNKSSQVAGVGYAPYPEPEREGRGDVFVQFHPFRGKEGPGPIYRYPNCTSADREAILHAESAGRFINVWKQDHTDFERLPTEPAEQGDQSDGAR